MESLIAEFSLEHIRTNRVYYREERRRTEIARCLATDLSSFVDEPLQELTPVEDIQKLLLN
jgi:lipopolysaccharide export system ATP-binding protein